MSLLGPDGKPIDSSQFKKANTPHLGPAFGDWAGRDVIWNQMPGGAVLQFDTESLTLADYRAMRNHPQINASLSVLTFVLHQVDWHIECTDKKIANKIDGMVRIFWTRMMRAMGQAFWAGYSPIALEYDNDVDNKSVVITKFKDLIPEDCAVNWKIVEGITSNTPSPVYADGVTSSSINSLVLGDNPNATTTGMPSTIKPKFREFNGIKQWGTPGPIPPEYSLWYPVLMENGNHWGRKLLKSAFAPWYFSTLIHLFANRYFERFGEPIPVGRAPMDEDFPDGNGGTISAKTAMENIIMNLRNRSVVVLPSDRQPVGGSGLTSQSAYSYDLEYLESQMRGADFEKYLQRLDEEMSLALFTPLLLLRNSLSGSHNLGVQHTQTWLWMLNSIAADMKEYIDRYVIDRLKSMNFSPNAPRAEWIPHQMGKQNPALLQAVLTALVTGGSTGVDLDELGQAVGLSLTQIDLLSGKPIADDEQPNGTEPGNIGGGLPPTPPSTGGSNPFNGGQPTPRPVRPGRAASNGGPRGVGEPRATGRQIKARIQSQVEKAWRDNRFGAQPLSFGYNQRFLQSLMAEGFAADEAESMTREFYDKLEAWTNDVVGLGVSQFTGPSDFMALFERHLDNVIDDLVAA